MQRCAGTIRLLVETLRGEDFQETGLAKRLLSILARLSRRQNAQEAIAASCFVDWAGEVLTENIENKTKKQQQQREMKGDWVDCCTIEANLGSSFNTEPL